MPDGSTVGVVEFDAQGAALTDRNGEVEAPVLDAQLVEVTQCLACEVADLGVVPLAFEFGDHDDRDDDVVLGEAEEGPRVAQQHRGVQHVRAEHLPQCVGLEGRLAVLPVWCSCGHNPLPPRALRPAVSESTRVTSRDPKGRLEQAPCPLARRYVRGVTDPRQTRWIAVTCS
jgi:hypothetical protein